MFSILRLIFLLSVLITPSQLRPSSPSSTYSYTTSSTISPLPTRTDEEDEDYETYYYEEIYTDEDYDNSWRTACGSKGNEFMAGGKVAQLGNYPWQVSLAESFTNFFLFTIYSLIIDLLIC